MCAHSEVNNISNIKNHGSLQLKGQDISDKHYNVQVLKSQFRISFKYFLTMTTKYTYNENRYLFPN